MKKRLFLFVAIAAVCVCLLALVASAANAITVSLSAPSTATVTAPWGGWVEGENTFNVTCNEEFSVFVSNDGGATYERLTAEFNAKSGYDFTVNLADDAGIVVRLYGDVNGDDSITEEDYTLAKCLFLDSAYESDAINRAMVDDNADGTITVDELTLIRRIIFDEDAKIEFVVLDSVADFELGKMYLNVYADGMEKVATLHKFENITLPDLPSWYFGIFVNDVENFYKGSIYAVKNTMNGMDVLGFVNDETYYNYIYEDKNGNERQCLQYIDLIDDVHGLINDGIITFDRGIVRVGAYGADLAYSERIRTTDTTVFYFIDYGTGIENEADTKIAVYVGAPKDATITLDEHTYILVDKIGYSKNTVNQGSTQLVIVVNALDYDFEDEVEPAAYGYFVGDDSNCTIGTAADFGLEGYAANTSFYEFEDGAINIDTGKTTTVYAPVPNLELGMVYEFDENGVILGYEDMTSSPVGVTLPEFANLSKNDNYELFYGPYVAIDYFYEEKTYEMSVADYCIFDYDDYIINKITLINIGEDIVVNRMGSSSLEYNSLSGTSAWNMVVNFFLYDDYNEIESDVFAVLSAENELILYVYAT